VDGRPLLVLGDTGEGQSGVIGEVGLYEADRGGQAPPDVDDEPIPQLARVCVPEDVSGVVVAVGAEGLADDRGVRAVNGTAAVGTAVFAGLAVASVAAAVPGTVDRAEGRRGQGDE
jgi:hypothetical protein